VLQEITFKVKIQFPCAECKIFVFIYVSTGVHHREIFIASQTLAEQGKAVDNSNLYIFLTNCAAIRGGGGGWFKNVRIM
jgi:hypothetical protein